MSLYNEYKQLDLPSIGRDILKFWDKEDIFAKSISTREGKTPFVFYEGPPSANGLPGIHHVMARTIKDIFCRYHTLKGKQVKRKAGWDTHGLPIELSVEKTLGITKEDIGKKISIEEYNQACRREVMKYTDKWEELTKMMGYWVDLEHPYVTYHNSYIESVWWLLKNLYEKKLLYKGYSIQPYSPAAGTGLSTHELNQPGCYRNVKDSSIVAQFKVRETEKLPFKSDGDIFFLAWTTTPWTLPANCALAVGENILYSAVKTFNPYTYKPITVILAKELLGKYFPEKNAALKLEGYKEGDKNIPFSVQEEFTGKQLAGIHYEQLLPYVQPEKGDAFRVIPGDFVTTEDGTGIVHTASVFGADDFRVCRQHNVPSILVKDEDGNQAPLVDKRGRFVKEVNDPFFGLAGEYVKEQYLSDKEKEEELKKQQERLKSVIPKLDKYLSTDERIGLLLKLRNKAFKIEKYEHSYPHCWRTDKPVLYYPLDSWFIKTTACKDRMIELNNTIQWKPAYTGTGRFGEWLNNLQDWNLSRSRFWGIPLPIWKEKNLLYDEICIGSLKELIRCKTNNDKEVQGFFFLEDNFKKYYQSLLTSNENVKEQLTNDIRNEFINHGNPKNQIKPESITAVYMSILESEGSALNNLPKNVLNNFIKEIKEEDLKDFDPHKPYIDKIIFIREEKINDFFPFYQRFVYLREPDLIDVWFDSGAMPYAQLHYPFENKELISPSSSPPRGGGVGGGAFPADFIAEGVDQTRGWFYTLHAIATMCFDSVAFKTVVSNGLVLDKNGNKMSKRLGNAVDPFATIGKYGPDAVRWYMVTNASPWDNLKFDIEGIAEVQRKFFGTLHNTYAFFALYANIDGFAYKEKEIPLEKRPEIDRWILSELNTLVKTVDEAYADYEPTKAGRAIEYFLDEHLSNWYVRLCRRRFWKGEYSEDKIAAFQTLYTCLEGIALLSSPIAPFYAERLFNDLNTVTHRLPAASVHLSDFPMFKKVLEYKPLEERMELAQQISSMVLSIRKKENIRVRQPLTRIRIPVLDNSLKEKIERVKELILSEVNVKQLEFADEKTSQIVKNLKLNFKTLGKKCGKHMKAVQAYAAENEQAIIREMEKNERYDVRVENKTYTLLPEDVEIIPVDIPGWKVANNRMLTVALDITLTPILLEEGIARELVNRIQNLRKDKGFDVTDRIRLKIQENKDIKSSVNNNLQYICSETLAGSLELVQDLKPGEAEVVEVYDSVKTLISITKYN